MKKGKEEERSPTPTRQSGYCWNRIYHGDCPKGDSREENHRAEMTGVKRTKNRKDKARVKAKASQRTLCRHLVKRQVDHPVQEIDRDVEHLQVADRTCNDA